MDIHYHKDYKKAFLKLSSKTREKIKNTIEIFQENPHDPHLDNHALHGMLMGFRSISAGGDLRLIFVQEDNYERVKFYFVGTHGQLYE